MTTEFTVTTKSCIKNQLKLHRFLFKESSHSDLTLEAKILYCFLTKQLEQQADSRGASISYDVAILKKDTGFTTDDLYQCKQELISKTLINISEKDKKQITLSPINSKFTGYFSLPDFINNPMFRKLDWHSKVIYAVFRNQYLYYRATENPTNNSNLITDDNIPLANIRIEELLKILNVTNESLVNYIENLKALQLIFIDKVEKGGITYYTTEPKSSSNTINLEESKKENLVTEWPLKISAYLKLFNYDEMNVLIGFFLDAIKSINDNYEMDFEIDIERDEQTLIALVREIQFNLRECSKSIVEMEKVIKSYVRSFFIQFAVKNMGMDYVKQKRFDIQKARESFYIAQNSVVDANIRDVRDVLEFNSIPTGSEKRDNINKEVVIHSLAALFNSYVPEKLFSHLMTIKQPNFYDVIQKLSNVLYEYTAFRNTGIFSFNINLSDVETRLIHGLKLYEYIFLYKDLDTKIASSQNYMIIFDQIDKSYNENHKLKNIPFNNTTIDKAIKEMEEDYPIIEF